MGWRDRAKPVSMGGSKPEAKAPASPAAPGGENPFVRMATDEMGRFGNAMVNGRSIGEHMPGGKMIADAGSAIGAGVNALTEMPFSSESFSNLYAKYRQPSLDIDKARDAADDASLSARMLKSGLAGLPVGAMKTAEAAAPAVETAVETSSQAPGWLSSGSKFSVRPENGNLFPAGEATAPAKGWLSGTSTAAPAAAEEAGRMAKMKDFLMTKGKDAAIDEGIEMLPYWIRRPIKLGRKMMGD